MKNKMMTSTQDSDKKKYEKDFEVAKKKVGKLERKIEQSVIDQEQFFRESHLKVQLDKEKYGNDPEG